MKQCILNHTLKNSQEIYNEDNYYLWRKVQKKFGWLNKYMMSGWRECEKYLLLETLLQVSLILKIGIFITFLYKNKFLFFYCFNWIPRYGRVDKHLKKSELLAVASIVFLVIIANLAGG